jgi:Spy/CpxP family protein refolding chaperone
MKHSIVLLISLACSTVFAQHTHPAAPQAPAAGGGTASLTAEQVKQLLDGEGMGLARSAEMNQYPGPKHLLELAKALSLTSDQQKEISAIREDMLKRARPLGQAIVDAERELDAAFRSGTITEADLRQRLDAIAKLQADLRLAHLRAHLLTKPLLTAEQIRKYDQLRAHAH